MDDWMQVRLGAALLLTVYAAVAAVFAPRELRFLSGLPARERRRFLALDILLQLAIAAALLPCILAPAPTRPTFMFIAAGFTALWILATWALVARYMYTYRLMLGRGGSAQELRQMLEQLDRERAAKEQQDD